MSTLLKMVHNTWTNFTKAKRYHPYRRPQRVIKAAQPGSPDKRHLLYAFKCHSCDHCEDSSTTCVFKVGKTTNLASRVRAYKTLNPDGYIFHTVECDNIHYAERILHDILKMQKYHLKQEVFQVPPGVLKTTMDLVQNLCQFIHISGKNEDSVKNVIQVLRETR